MSSLRSEALNELAAALAKAQGEMPIAGKASLNPHYNSKYASLSDIVKASRPSLSKNGLSVSQRVMVREDGITWLHTMLLHSSGQYLESTIKLKPLKDDHQAFGSCLSYMKKYAYAAIVGVISEEEDDDGEEAMRDYREEGRGGNPHPTESDTISKDQLNMLQMDLRNCPQEIAERILKHYKIQSLGEIRKREIGRVKEFIATSKKTLGVD